MRPVGKTTRKHRRQQKAGKPRHKLRSGRTGKSTSTKLKNGLRGKAAKAVGKPRNVRYKCHDPEPISVMAYSVK